jgi:sugar lactone lactonase YvrE
LRLVEGSSPHGVSAIVNLARDVIALGGWPAEQLTNFAKIPPRLGLGFVRPTLTRGLEMHMSATLCKQSAATAAIIVASGCSTAVDYSAPASFTVSNDAVAHVVQQALNRTTFATHGDGPPTVECSGETRCTIAYTVQEPVGFVNEIELVLPTRQMWKAMFTDPHFQSGTITVSGPAKTLRGKDTSVLFTLSCDRSAASQIDWNNVDAKGLKTSCDYTRQVELPFTGLNGPTGVAVDAAGNVYVTDNHNNRVLRLPSATNGMASHLTHTNPVELPLNAQAPSNVAVIAGDVYVTDNGRVLKLPAGWNTPIELPFVVSAPAGVAVDNAGDVYVTDGGSHRVFRLPAWSTTQVEVPFGDALGGLPGGVALDKGGTVYVTGKDSVWKLPAGANTPTRLPFTGLKSPSGVAVDTDCLKNPGMTADIQCIYVTDGLDKDHSRVLALLAGSTAPFELPFTGLNRPTGVTVDTAGNVYVADSGNNRVLELPSAAVRSAVALSFDH